MGIFDGFADDAIKYSAPKPISAEIGQVGAGIQNQITEQFAPAIKQEQYDKTTQQFDDPAYTSQLLDQISGFEKVVPSQYAMQFMSPEARKWNEDWKKARALGDGAAQDKLRQYRKQIIVKDDKLKEGLAMAQKLAMDAPSGRGGGGTGTSNLNDDHLAAFNKQMIDMRGKMTKEFGIAEDSPLFTGIEAIGKSLNPNSYNKLNVIMNSAPGFIRALKDKSGVQIKSSIDPTVTNYIREKFGTGDIALDKGKGSLATKYKAYLYTRAAKGDPDGLNDIRGLIAMNGVARAVSDAGLSDKDFLSQADKQNAISAANRSFNDTLTSFDEPIKVQSQALVNNFEKAGFFEFGKSSVDKTEMLNTIKEIVKKRPDLQPGSSSLDKYQEYRFISEMYRDLTGEDYETSGAKEMGLAPKPGITGSEVATEAKNVAVGAGKRAVTAMAFDIVPGAEERKSGVDENARPYEYVGNKKYYKAMGNTIPIPYVFTDYQGKKHEAESTSIFTDEQGRTFFIGEGPEAKTGHGPARAGRFIYAMQDGKPILLGSVSKAKAILAE